MNNDITLIVNKFIQTMQNDETHRYRSFDFCYTHFYFSKINQHIDIEKSCYILWGYLASWGMLRGSSFLLQYHNPAYLRPLVEFIYQQDSSIWEIDVNNYPEKYSTILELYKNIKSILIKNNERALTLITKILLGVFGIVSAYDTYFIKAFKNISQNNLKHHCGFSSFNKDSLHVIHQFYLQNKDTIDELSQDIQLITFKNTTTGLFYSKAKIIDMYGFQKGFEL